MLHGIINKQGLGVRDKVQKKMNIFRIFSYKSLASGAKVLGILKFISDDQAHVPLLQML